MKSGTIKTIVSVLLLYGISTVSTYAVFRSQTPVPVTPPQTVTAKPNGELNIPPEAPRTEVCPLNGKMYTVAEKDIYAKRRPLAIMVENSVEARPQSGLIRADVIYEAVAEGGVTRFMPVFLCDVARSDVLVAPVRSVRTYFLDWASEYGETPLFGHVLGANCSAEVKGGPCKSDPRAQAIEQLSKYGWRYNKGNDLDQAAIGAPTYRRNEARLFSRTGQNVATEHSMEGQVSLLYKIAADRGWTNLDPEGTDWTKSFGLWKFKDDAEAAGRGGIAAISYDFWTGYKQFDVRWEYDATNNVYKRYTGGEPHTDLETNTQITVKNVVVQLTKEIGPVDDLKHMLYTTTGEGKAYIFQDGQAIEGYWQKKNRLSRTRFFTKKGVEVEFTRGPIWISVNNSQTEVVY